MPYPAPLVVRAFKEEGVLELWAAPRRGRTVPDRSSRGRSPGTAATSARSDGGATARSPRGSTGSTASTVPAATTCRSHVDYPNQADRLFAHRRHPGNNIFIHGNELTNGCIPIGDRAIEQLYIAVLDSRNAGYEVPVAPLPVPLRHPGVRAPPARRHPAQPEAGGVLGQSGGRVPVVRDDGHPPGGHRGRGWPLQLRGAGQHHRRDPAVAPVLGTRRPGALRCGIPSVPPGAPFCGATSVSSPMSSCRSARS